MSVIKKKQFTFISLILISVLILSGCGGGDSDPNDNLVDDNVRTQDFSYTYPAQWETTQNDSFLTNFKNLYNDVLGYNAYSSGALTKGTNEQRFAIMTLDVSSYQSSLSQNDLIDFKNSFQYSFEYNNSSATLIEEANTTIDGQSAVKMSYEFGYSPRSRLDIIATYRGLKFYMIVYGTEDVSNYNDNAGLFNDIKDSINLY
jgi:hypothetical protein